MDERDSPFRGGGATTLTTTTEILETADRQVGEEFSEDADWVGEARHHIGKALDIIRANTEPATERLE